MKVIKFKTKTERGQIIEVSTDEAYNLMHTLSAQLVHKSANVGRKEFLTDKGEYFSIAVQPDPKKDRKLEWQQVYALVEKSQKKKRKKRKTKKG